MEGASDEKHLIWLGFLHGRQVQMDPILTKRTYAFALLVLPAFCFFFLVTVLKVSPNQLVCDFLSDIHFMFAAFISIPCVRDYEDATSACCSSWWHMQNGLWITKQHNRIGNSTRPETVKLIQVSIIHCDAKWGKKGGHGIMILFGPFASTQISKAVAAASCSHFEAGFTNANLWFFILCKAAEGLWLGPPCWSYFCSLGCWSGIRCTSMVRDNTHTVFLYCRCFARWIARGLPALYISWNPGSSPVFFTWPGKSIVHQVIREASFTLQMITSWLSNPNLIHNL